MDFGFPAVLALLCLTGDGGFLLQTLAVCMIHEIGHGIAMILTRAGIREIRFYAAGIQMWTHAAALPKRKELLILVSGPCMNFGAALLLHFLQCEGDAAALHLCMGIFNLLPYAVLDGGSALRYLLAEHPQLLRLQTVLCVLLSAAAVVLLAVYRVKNPFLPLMAVYLAGAQLRVDKQGGMW